MKHNPRWRATVDDVVHELRMTANTMSKSEAERHWMRCAADDIAWYLRTDRAPYEWWWALLKADAYKILKRMADADNKSTAGQIQIATEYLKRYCGYIAK